jgi:hypothetical protein
MSQPIKGVRKATQEDFDFAVGLFNQGEQAESVRGKLVERGLTQAAADGVIGRIFLQSVYGRRPSCSAPGRPPTRWSGS